MSMKDKIESCDRLKETDFSGLFHEARTTKSRICSGVSVPVKVQENEITEVGDPVKTRQGEHFRVRNSNKWNNVVSLPVKPFMDTQTAKSELKRQVREIERPRN